jgi:hypothetical protein
VSNIELKYNYVTFNNAAGVVTGATTTSLTVTFSVAPAAGTLTAARA